ncbi:type II toxin -antitoxin system TacA 1-like antitoxin [Desulfovibrio piger]|uniref:type II toxin -antitoxin system TacA 1-like antitoxin n=1 Tax=Desulfovibrio piger TaxID=901 RepID=UPI003F09DA7F
MTEMERMLKESLLALEGELAASIQNSTDSAHKILEKMYFKLSPELCGAFVAIMDAQEQPNPGLARLLNSPTP